MAKYRGRAPKTRARIIEIKAKLGRRGAEPKEIIDALKQKHSNIIRAERDDLIDLGLSSIVNSVCNLKGGVGNSRQPDLFKGFDLPFTLTVRASNGSGDIRSIKKNFDAMTKAEVAQYIEDHTNTPPKTSKRTSEVQRFFERYAKFGDENSTMMQCWKLAQTHPGDVANAR